MTSDDTTESRRRRKGPPMKMLPTQSDKSPDRPETRPEAPDVDLPPPAAARDYQAWDAQWPPPSGED